ncbi:unnamed protein product [Alternaria sp. RS040]
MAAPSASDNRFQSNPSSATAPFRYTAQSPVTGVPPSYGSSLNPLRSTELPPASVPALKARWPDIDFGRQYDTAEYPGHVYPDAKSSERERKAWGWAREQLDLRAVDIELQAQRRRRGADFTDVNPPPPDAQSVLQLFNGMWAEYLAQESRRKETLIEPLSKPQDVTVGFANMSLSEGDATRPTRSDVNHYDQPKTFGSTATPAQPAGISGDDFTQVRSKKDTQQAKKATFANALKTPHKSKDTVHASEVEEDFSRWHSLLQGKMPPKDLKYNCGVRKSGRLDYAKYKGTARMDLNLCAYHFSDNSQRHWSIEAGPGGKERWVDKKWLKRIKAKKGYKHEYPPDDFSCRTQYAGLPRYYMNGDVILPGGQVVPQKDENSLKEEHKMILRYQVAPPAQ